LGEDDVECGGDEERFDSHLGEAGDGGCGVVGVEAGEDEVAGVGSFDGDLGGFFVAGFADEDDVGVLAEDGSEGVCEGESDFRVDLDLADALEAVFDGVFCGDDVHFGTVEDVEGGIQGGGFP